MAAFHSPARNPWTLAAWPQDGPGPPSGPAASPMSSKDLDAILDQPILLQIMVGLASEEVAESAVQTLQLDSCIASGIVNKNVGRKVLNYSEVLPGGGM